MSQKPTNDRKIILITGGQRSGKSLYAEQMALALSAHPIYLATARIWDDEFAQRVAVHRERRGSEWTNIEEEKVLSRHNPLGEVILIDCLTLWATNYFFDNDSDVELAYAALCAEFDSSSLPMRSDWEEWQRTLSRGILPICWAGSIST